MQSKRGIKLRQTLLAKFGSEERLRQHFQEIGRIGGSKGHTGGFYANRELASQVGGRGGKKSKRHPQKCQCSTCMARQIPRMGTPWYHVPFTGNTPYEPVRRVE